MSNTFMNRFNAARAANTRARPAPVATPDLAPIAHVAPTTPAPVAPAPATPVAGGFGGSSLGGVFGRVTESAPTTSSTGGGFGGGFSGLFTPRTPPARTPVDPNRYIDQRNQVRAAAAAARQYALRGQQDG